MVLQISKAVKVSGTHELKDAQQRSKWNEHTCETKQSDRSNGISRLVDAHLHVSLLVLNALAMTSQHAIAAVCPGGSWCLDSNTTANFYKWEK